MTYIYDKSGQKIYFQREGSTYGKVYDPESSGLTAFTAVPASYAHWRRLDIIEDTFDVPLPFIEKIKKYDLDALKHPSAILSGNIAPVDITFDMVAQGLEFLPMAIGKPAFSDHTESNVMTQTITCQANTAITDESYFLLDVVLVDNSIDHYLFWFDQSGTGSAPTSPIGIADSNRFEISVDGVNGDTAAKVATLVATVINTQTDVSASATGAIVTVTHDLAGAVQQGREGGTLGSTGLIFGVTVWGSTTYTVAELIDTTLPTFTIHVEQQNQTSAEDLVYDLFGCVVESITVTTAYGDQVTTYNVSMKCPYALPGNKSTNPPPKKYIQSFPAMSALQETPDNYLIMEKDAYAGTTYSHQDRTPQTVDSVVLTITNNVQFKGNISKRYMVLPVAGKREITLQIVGNTDEKELFQYFLEEFTNDGTDWMPTSASGRLFSVYKLQRDATYDYISISFYNWLCQEHNFSFVSVDDAVKTVDMTFTDGSSDSNGRIVSALTFISMIDRIVMVI